MSQLTQKYLKTALDYNPDTGIFIWLKNRSGKLINTRAGNVSSSGLTMICVQSEKINAGRLAMLYMTGNLPDHVGFHDKKQSNTKYNNLFISDKKMVYRKQKDKENIAPDANIIIQAMEGKTTFTNSEIAKQLHVKSTYIIYQQLTELIRDGYTEQTAVNSGRYRLTTKGHQAIVKKIDVTRNETSDLLMHFFTQCCPGKGPQTSYY